jgi:hypothetical protein
MSFVWKERKKQKETKRETKACLFFFVWFLFIYLFPLVEHYWLK